MVESKLPCGEISGDELIVVEGRADVVNMLRNRVNNVIGMDGTKLPPEIAELSKEKRDHTVY
jgi:DNA primase